MENTAVIKFPLHITYRHFPASAALEAAVRKRAEKLGRFFNNIISCRVLVEAPHRHHRKGKLYHIRIDVVVPQAVIVVEHEPRSAAIRWPIDELSHLKLMGMRPAGKHGSHCDVYVAIRDGFDAVHRKLQDYIREKRSA